MGVFITDNKFLKINPKPWHLPCKLLFSLGTLSCIRILLERSRAPHYFAASETWLVPNPPSVCSRLVALINYVLFRNETHKWRVGGVSIYVHDRVRVVVMGANMWANYLTNEFLFIYLILILT